MDMLQNFGWILLVFFAFSACQSDPKSPSDKVVEEISPNSGISNSDIIRNPISADQPVDTINVAKLGFDDFNYDFGTVEEGENVKHVFGFTNTGKAPLIITNATSTCGCTIPKWSKEPIAPGERGEVDVNFNTKGKKNYQAKPITITANTHPPQTVIHLIGTVKPAKE